MGDVREPGAARPKSRDQLERLLHGLVHGVWRVAERVQHQFLGARQQRDGFLRNAAEVGEVRQAPNAKAQHRHIPVFGGNGLPGSAQQLERALDLVRSHLRNCTQRRLPVKHVGESPPQDRQCFFGGINRHGRFLAQIEGANIVKSQDMVGVSVRKNDGIEAFESLTQGLKAEVGRGIDDHVMILAGDQNRRPGTIVVGVLGTADAAMAAEAGNAHGGARAEHGHANRGSIFRGAGERHLRAFATGGPWPFPASLLPPLWSFPYKRA